MKFFYKAPNNTSQIPNPLGIGLIADQAVHSITIRPDQLEAIARLFAATCQVGSSAANYILWWTDSGKAYVKHYGAIGDATWDCFPAAQCCYQSQLAGGLGATVVWEPGKYRVTDQIVNGYKFVDDSLCGITTPVVDTVTGYNAGLYTSSLAAPLIHTQFEAGAIVWGNYTVTKSVFYNGITPDPSGTGQGLAVKYDGLCILGNDAMAMGGAFLSPSTGSAPATNVMGFFAAKARVLVTNFSGRSLKRGGAMCGCYWSNVQDVQIFHAVDGFVDSGMNAAEAHRLKVSYCTTGVSLSGQGFEASGIASEECGTTLYVPSADGCDIGVTYAEATGSGLTDYQVKIGDGTNTVVECNLRIQHLTSTSGKSVSLAGGVLNIVSIDSGSHLYPSGSSGLHCADGNCTLLIAANASVAMDPASSAFASIYRISETMQVLGLKVTQGGRDTSRSAQSGIQIGDRGGIAVDSGAVTMGFYADTAGTPNNLMELYSGRTKNNGAFDNEISTHNAAHTLGEFDHFSMEDGSVGSYTATLPQASTVPGREYVFKRTDTATSNTVTITAHSGDTIEGSASTTLTSQYQTVRLLAYPNSNTWMRV